MLEEAWVVLVDCTGREISERRPGLFERDGDTIANVGTIRWTNAYGWAHAIRVINIDGDYRDNPLG